MPYLSPYQCLMFVQNKNADAEQPCTCKNTNLQKKLRICGKEIPPIVISFVINYIRRKSYPVMKPYIYVLILVAVGFLLMKVIVKLLKPTESETEELAPSGKRIIRVKSMSPQKLDEAFSELRKMYDSEGEFITPEVVWYGESPTLIFIFTSSASASPFNFSRVNCFCVLVLAIL